MIKRRKKASLVDIEVGSFSDVAFLLIIFFILTTQIAKFLGQNLTIPSGAPAQNQQKVEDKQITINLFSDTNIQFSAGSEQNVPVTLEQLKMRLLQENFPVKAPDQRFVIVDAKDEIKYDTYFKVVMLITDAGGVLSLIDYGKEEEGGK